MNSKELDISEVTFDAQCSDAYKEQRFGLLGEARRILDTMDNAELEYFVKIMNDKFDNGVNP